MAKKTWVVGWGTLVPKTIPTIPTMGEWQAKALSWADAQMGRGATGTGGYYTVPRGNIMWKMWTRGDLG